MLGSAKKFFPYLSVVPTSNRYNDSNFPVLTTRMKRAINERSIVRQTHIVCTMGPACDSETHIEALIKAGMNIARLNFSHGTHAHHAQVVARIRTISQGMNYPVTIMQDLQGPKIRIGTFANGQGVELMPGAEFIITTRKVKGNAQQVSTSYGGLPENVHSGDRLLLDDGLIELVVTKVAGTDVHTCVVNGGLLKDHKGINLPGIEVNLPALTEKDREDLFFGVQLGVDCIAISFVNRAEDIIEVKKVLASLGSHAELLPVIAKIETASGVANLDVILKAADGVMVARGDLGVELSPEFVPPIQKRIIKSANILGKFVITATQMLESMVKQPRPTRAEAADVVNAVYDGTNAVMLSAETASGSYPVEAVKMMARLINVAEATMFEWGRSSVTNTSRKLSVPWLSPFSMINKAERNHQPVKVTNHFLSTSNSLCDLGHLNKGNTGFILPATQTHRQNGGLT